MIELEKLYDCADKYLLKTQQDWQGFAQEFAQIFSAKMALYRPTNKKDRLYFLSMDELIATTNPEIMQEFFENDIIKFRPMFEDAGRPLEPLRRTDVLSDEQFRNAEVTKAFLQPNNVFYLMIVHAILPDKFLLVLYLWRSEQENDFSDLEKQRLALFMRYLATFIKEASSNEIRQHIDKDIADFGKKYHLTDAEIEILSAMLDGKSLRFIAENSSRSYGTVRWHVQHILEKCHVGSQKNLLKEFYALIKR